MRLQGLRTVLLDAKLVLVLVKKYLEVTKSSSESFDLTRDALSIFGEGGEELLLGLRYYVVELCDLITDAAHALFVLVGYLVHARGKELELLETPRVSIEIHLDLSMLHLSLRLDVDKLLVNDLEHCCTSSIS